MPIEQREDAFLITHALAKDTLSTLRSVETEQVGFREGLVDLGRVCGYEIIDGAMDSEFVPIETPLAETTGERVTGLDDVVIVTVLRAATPFVEGLMKAFPRARQGVISASRDEAAGMDDDGEFPITVDYVKLPEITDEIPSSSPTRCWRRGRRCVPFSITSSMPPMGLRICSRCRRCRPRGRPPR
jgi:uracil phosphoribosyltransferase (EC 2.4.2.9)